AKQLPVPKLKPIRAPCRGGKGEDHYDDRPVQRDVVIGVADRRRDGDDLAAAFRFSRDNCRRDFLPVGVGEGHHHDPDAPPPPNEPPPPEKPPKPPPPPPPQEEP